MFSILPNGEVLPLIPESASNHNLFKDFIRVVFGQKGGDDATASDQINVLGSHYGSYDFKLSYTKRTGEDIFIINIISMISRGMEFANKTDGLWGIQVDLPTIPLAK